MYGLPYITGLAGPVASTRGPVFECVCSDKAVTPAMAFSVLFALALLSLTAGCASASASFQQQCISFDPTSLGLGNATVMEHAYIESGTNLSLADNDPSCNLKSQVVSANLCRVALQIATSGSSGVVAEIWLPENWNGRLLTTGNGGLGGCERVLFPAQAKR
jgi:feruloyl esterase